jgi:hypothetical protein
MLTTYPQNDPQPSFLGRNGYFHSQGLEITRMGCGLIALQPITTKGKTARCTIELPGDAKTLREIAQHLLDLAGIATPEPVAERNEYRVMRYNNGEEVSGSCIAAGTKKACEATAKRATRTYGTEGVEFRAVPCIR